MKIEIGESLIYSFLRHEKNCLVTQTNWKPSGNWKIPSELFENVTYEFNKINKHHAFSEIFKSDLSQTLKQAEIDVLGIDQYNHIYAFEVAFHENGLQYGGKIDSRNRVIKKLLRGYLTLKCYFPDKKYSIAFCSPKVNPATEKHIRDYFQVLVQDFGSEEIGFYYYSNEQFYREIVQNTLSKSTTEADSSELFTRSIKLFNLTSTYSSKEIHQETPQQNLPAANLSQPPSINFAGHQVKIGGISIPLDKDDTESVQDYIKMIMRLLLNNKTLSNDEIERLQDKKYCKNVFALQFPLIRNIAQGYKDSVGKNRYWSKEVFGGKYYVCSQWWKAHHSTHLLKFKEWLIRLQDESLPTEPHVDDL